MEAAVTLPLVLMVTLVELAVGGAFLLWFVDRTTDAPSGFLKLVAFVDVAVIGFAVLLVGVPYGATAASVGLDVERIGQFQRLVLVIAVLSVLQLGSTFSSARRFRDATGIAVATVGAFALGLAAAARPGGQPFDLFALAALPIGALAVGGSNAAMLLGHWYLVTPKLSTGPLRVAALAVAAAVALQLLLVLVALARGQLAGIGDDVPLLVATLLRVGVGIGGTFFVALAAWWTARTNTQSSTGLLYVGLGTALAGEVSARVVFFLTGTAI